MTAVQEPGVTVCAVRRAAWLGLTPEGRQEAWVAACDDAGMPPQFAYLASPTAAVIPCTGCGAAAGVACQPTEAEPIVDVGALRERAERAEAKVSALGDELRASLEREREQVRLLSMVATDYDNVWLWQGDGYDYPESLTCSVVMSADTVRAFDTARRALDGVERRLSLAIGRGSVEAMRDDVVDALRACRRAMGKVAP